MFTRLRRFFSNISVVESQSSTGTTRSDPQSYLSLSKQPNNNYRPMPDPLSVYVPLNSLTEKTVDSLISTIQQSEKTHWHSSKCTILAFLLAINNKVSEIEKNNDSNNKFNEETIQQATKVRQWLIEKDRSSNTNEPLDWDKLRINYEKIINNNDNTLRNNFRVEIIRPYEELTIPGVHPDVNQSRAYMHRYRSHGWEPHELKVYWNVKQLENLCPKQQADDVANDEAKSNQIKEESDTKEYNLLSHDPSDADVIIALRQYPVSKRNYLGKITYVHKGIQQAVFDAPENVQLIVLNFANERSPGGGYLRHAWAQEEIILYNSDGYRSLLDLKYGRMGGGYAIPEFGLAYVRDIRFFDKKSDKIREADILVSACYCLSGSPQLYKNPTSNEEWKTNNLAKFRAFIAAAVANTKGDGSNTYLLLGPIGTGAFGNDVNTIGDVFCEVLSSKMMGSNGPIRNAFGNIWFVSTDKWKNDRFEKIFSEDDITKAE